MFQVSRGSIREVIKSLQMMGILESKSGQGTFLRKNALQKIRGSRFINMINDEQYRDQVLECRYLIEPQVDSNNKARANVIFSVFSDNGNLKNAPFRLSF